ncbi:MAG: homocysteine S-methyltransferase family protein [Dehalococcoidales bacterium]|nr:homocysteine S-methyltransferase family protein [Dehalococcoidales bacterium]
MKLSEFIAASQKPILLDGAMGTQLAEEGLEMGGHTTVSHPDAVLDIHRKYLDSGADIIITNTLTMNRVSTESHKTEVDIREVNLLAAKLARTAAGKGQYVLGDIGSTGKLLKPYGSLPKEEALKAYREQASILAEGGVDGFIIETMIDLQEALCALQACREIGDLPVIASIAFNTVDRGGRTVMGNTAQDCARALTEAGATVIGTNCGSLDPLQISEIVSRMKEVSPLPIIAQPNAGRPKMIDKRIIFDMSPSDFASGLMKCLQAGARLIGGCCGTSPAHIRAIAQMLDKK